MRLPALVTAVAVCLATLACASPRTAFTLHVSIAPDANDRAPIPVDVVFVWDKAAMAKVSGLTAADWFSTKAQFRRDDPEHRSLTVCEWEWVPGQAVPDINLAVPAAARRWAYGVFVFARYRTAGTHRSSLTPGAASVLELRRGDAALRSVGESRASDYAWIEDRCPVTPMGERSSS